MPTIDTTWEEKPIDITKEANCTINITLFLEKSNTLFLNIINNIVGKIISKTPQILSTTILNIALKN